MYGHRGTLTRRSGARPVTGVTTRAARASGARGQDLGGSSSTSLTLKTQKWAARGSHFAGLFRIHFLAKKGLAYMVGKISRSR